MVSEPHGHHLDGAEKLEEHDEEDESDENGDDAHVCSLWVVGAGVFQGVKPAPRPELLRRACEQVNGHPRQQTGRENAEEPACDWAVRAKELVGPAPMLTNRVPGVFACHADKLDRQADEEHHGEHCGETKVHGYSLDLGERDNPPRRTGCLNRPGNRQAVPTTGGDRGGELAEAALNRRGERSSGEEVMPHHPRNLHATAGGLHPP